MTFMIAELIQKKSKLEDLCTKYKVQRLAVFGSARRGDFDPSSSDFDFTVEFQDLGPGMRADAYFGMLFGLQDLLGRDVDLVEFGALNNKYLKEIIRSERELLYEAA